MCAWKNLGVDILDEFADCYRTHESLVDLVRHAERGSAHSFRLRDDAPLEPAELAGRRLRDHLRARARRAALADGPGTSPKSQAAYAGALLHADARRTRNAAYAASPGGKAALAEGQRRYRATDGGREARERELAAARERRAAARGASPKTTWKLTPELRQWAATCELSGAEAARQLGVTRSTVAKLRKAARA